MFRVGAHVSISDGLPAAVSEQCDLGGNTGQIFVGSPRTWAVSAVDPEEASEFNEASEVQNVGPWIVHGTYLINFATPKPDLAEKSVEAVQAELEATAALDIPYYVFHPGAHTGAGVEAGLSNVSERLSDLDIPAETTLLLENTAGKGTTLGKTLPELESMIGESALTYDDVGICLDSCHLWAAGYDFSTPEGMDELVEDVSATVGLDNLQYLHLNDSEHPLGSQKDEHAHIGEGDIGSDAFGTFVNHDDVRDLPMVLETPVDEEKGYAWNIEQLQELRVE